MQPSSLAVAENGSPVEVGNAQAWLRTRFEGLTPEDFSKDGVLVYSACDLIPPEGFQHVWQRIASHHRVEDMASEEERRHMSCVSLLLVLADAKDQEQMHDVTLFGRFVDSLRTSHCSPYVILVLHSVSPRVWDSKLLSVTRALNNGIDDAVFDETTSFKLAWAVQSRLLIRDKLLQDVRRLLMEKNNQIMRRNVLRSIHSNIVWDYSRARLAKQLPPVDQGIPRGEPQKISGFDVGDLLGEGASSRVFKLTLEGVPTRLAVKMLRKPPLESIQGIKSLSEQIKVMTLLNAQAGQHQHMVRMQAIFHSTTHIFFFMEDGGSQNLLIRLHHRDMMARAVSSVKAMAIIEQIVAAMCHLHLVARIAHLDIDTANILVSETNTNIIIKICDFDTAVVETGEALTKVVGSHPFAAPEVVLQESYLPLLVDIWSMAAVFVEIICHMNVVDEALGLFVTPSQKTLARKVYAFFERQDSVKLLLMQHLRPELLDLMGVEIILTGMLHVKCTGRWNCSKVVDGFSRAFA